MSTGLASPLMLDVAASQAADRQRGARERAQTADARRTRMGWLMAFLSR